MSAHAAGLRPRHIAWKGLGPLGPHELHATEWGSRRHKRVIVCAHGFSGNGRDFDFLAQELASGARVICPDVAGRGRSAWLGSTLAYHFPQFLADFRSLLSHLRVDAVDWIGTSMGGLLGLMMATQPASPVRSLVMNDVGAFVPANALRRIARNLQAPESFDSMAEVEAHLRHTHRDWGALRPRQWAHLARYGARRTAGGYRLHYDPKIARVMQPVGLVPGLFFWDRWYRVECPVLLVRGERSKVFPPQVARTMVGVKPARLVELPDCGHAPALMSREHTDPILDFLGQGKGKRRPAAGVSKGRSGPAPWPAT